MNIEKVNHTNLKRDNILILKEEQKKIEEIKESFKEDKKEMYSFLYDIIYEYLEDTFLKNNYCDFKDNMCIANRNGTTLHEKMGCCYSFDYNKLIYMNNRLCIYVGDNGCTIKCISCKLWTCKYLREKGISFKIKDIPIARKLFNKKQQDIIENNLFKTKEQIIDKLLEKDYLPYFIYVILEKYLI